MVPLGKRARAKAIWPFSTRVKRSLRLGRLRADRDGAGDVGGAVDILGTGIDEIGLAGFERPVGALARPVVDDGAVRPGAGDRVEAEIAEEIALPPEARQPVDGGELVDLALRRGLGQPMKEARHRRPIAAMGAARALELGLVLAGLGQQAGIVALDDACPRLRQPVEDPGGRPWPDRPAPGPWPDPGDRARPRNPRAG